MAFSKPLDLATIILLDEHGRLTTTFRASGRRVDLDLSNMAAGVYFVRIADAKNVLVKRVVKLQQ